MCRHHGPEKMEPELDNPASRYPVKSTTSQLWASHSKAYSWCWTHTPNSSPTHSNQLARPPRGSKKAGMLRKNPLFKEPRGVKKRPLPRWVPQLYKPEFSICESISSVSFCSSIYDFKKSLRGMYVPRTRQGQCSCRSLRMGRVFLT